MDRGTNRKDLDPNLPTGKKISEDRGVTRGKGNGSVFVFSAPSGAGKTTLLSRVMRELPGLRFSVSYTTRFRRSDEQEGKDYHFVSLSVFQGMIDRGEFLEWAEVLGNRYGTGCIDLAALERERVDLVLDIDTQGAKKVKEELPRPVLVFILPPSFSVLGERLVKRAQDPPEVIRYRMASAMKEISEAHWYEYIVINDDIEEAVDQIKAIVIAERCRKQKDSILAEKMKQWRDTYGKNYR